MMLPGHLLSGADWPLRQPALPPAWSDAKLGDDACALRAAHALFRLAADPRQANQAFALEVALELRYPRLRHALVHLLGTQTRKGSRVLDALDQLDEAVVAVRRGEDSAPTLALRLALTLVELFGPES